MTGVLEQELARQADAIRKLAKHAIETTIESVIEIGERLIECQKLLKDEGRFVKWIKTEFDWSERTAYNYITIAKSKFATVAKLDLKSLYLLTAPSTPEEARAEVADRAAKGEKMKHSDVADTVRRHKAKTATTKAPGKTAAAILEQIKAAGPRGMTTPELQDALAPQHHRQTVNSTTNNLLKSGALCENGETRKQKDANGGRAPKVWIINPDPDQRPVKKGSKSKKVVRFSDHKLNVVIAAIDDGRLLAAFKQWKSGKPEKVVVSKLLDIIQAGIGVRGTNAMLKLRDRYWQEEHEKGNTIDFNALYGRRDSWPRWAREEKKDAS